MIDIHVVCVWVGRGLIEEWGTHIFIIVLFIYNI